MTSYIYSLRDPVSLRCRYVGKSNNPVERLQGHLKKARQHPVTYKDHWLLTLSCPPILEILEYYELEDEWPDSEKWWIKEMRRRGEPLTNGTPGGEGGGVIHTFESRRKIGEANQRRRGTGLMSGRVPWNKGKKTGPGYWIGKHHSEETKVKISAAGIGRQLSDEHKEKLRVNHKVATGWHKKTIGIGRGYKKAND